MIAQGGYVKVLAVLIIVIALVIIIVPQFTNCEYGRDNGATSTTSTDTTATVVYASMTSPAAAATMPYRMMKCYWAAHAEIIAGVPLLAIGALLLFARRKETTRALGILTAVLGVLTVLIPTSVVGTCLNEQMVCNTQMKPALLIAGGIIVALGVAVVVVGEMKRESGGNGGVAAA
jgi:CHASE2 domain-containing sensor protein